MLNEVGAVFLESDTDRMENRNENKNRKFQPDKAQNRESKTLSTLLDETLQHSGQQNHTSKAYCARKAAMVVKARGRCPSVNKFARLTIAIPCGKLPCNNNEQNQRPTDNVGIETQHSTKANHKKLRRTTNGKALPVFRRFPGKQPQPPSARSPHDRTPTPAQRQECSGSLMPTPRTKRNENGQRRK